MDDIYQSLIAGTPDQAKIPALVDQLRRRRALGELGALTGDQVLSPFGSGLVKESDKYAEQLGENRLKAADDTRAADYQKALTDHQAQVLKATLDRDKETGRYHQGLVDAALARAKAAQDAVNAKAAAGPKKSKLRTTDITALQEDSATVRGMDDIMKQMDEGISIGTKKAFGLPVPGSRALANTAAAMGYGSDADKKSYALFQQWDRLYNLAARNKLFGATLSTNEQRAWAAANPSVAQTDEQIRAAIPIMQKVYQNKLEKRMKGLKDEGYDETAIRDYAGMGSPEGGDPVDSSQGEPDMPTDDDARDFAEAYQTNPKGALAAFKKAFPGVDPGNFIPAQ